MTKASVGRRSKRDLRTYFNSRLGKSVLQIRTRRLPGSVKTNAEGDKENPGGRVA